MNWSAPGFAQRLQTPGREGEDASMTMSDAQEAFRSIYRGGSVGLAVAGLVWSAATITTLAVGINWGIVVMVGVGFFIYPLTLVGLKMLGGHTPISPNNPLRGLSVEAPFVGPMMLPLVGAAALYRIDWFYPSMMLAIGAHYLPFSSLYGMKMFRLLGAIMSAGGVSVALWAPGLSTAAAAATALLMFVFAFVAYQSTTQDGEKGQRDGSVD